ncbi:hypothetical protein HDV04_003053 [Boothiomyces sp. JEL0838]|nr:hypothetical protein HDV04_003053 [Boothiomyces sp. JEL0838]
MNPQFNQQQHFYRQYPEDGKFAEEDKIYQHILDLNNTATREQALLELSKKREAYEDLAPILWHSFGVMAALLQEIVSVYPLLTPPTLTGHASNRVCNALALLQCIASHSETRTLFLSAHIPLFLYPFLNTTNKTRPFEYLRLTSLGVIGALVKNDNSEVINFLLSTEIIPLCLRIMETGSELSKTVAIFIVQKILLDEMGLNYICQTYERFYAVGTVLSNMVAQLVEQQSIRLLKHVIRCYLRLSDNPRAREALRQCLPQPLRDATFAMILKDDITTKRIFAMNISHLPIYAIAKGEYYVLAGADHSIHIASLDKVEQTLYTKQFYHSDWITNLALSNNDIYSAGMDGKIIQWRLKGSKYTGRSICKYQSSISCLIVTDRVYASSYDGTVCIYTFDLDLVEQIQLSKSPITKFVLPLAAINKSGQVLLKDSVIQAHDDATDIYRAQELVYTVGVDGYFRCFDLRKPVSRGRRVLNQFVFNGLSKLIYSGCFWICSAVKVAKWSNGLETVCQVDSLIYSMIVVRGIVVLGLKSGELVVGKRIVKKSANAIRCFHYDETMDVLVGAGDDGTMYQITEIKDECNI